MAACIVCNQHVGPDDGQDAGEMAKLHDRLQKVLNEAVPVNSVMCGSCQFDLAQIEMYYALLTVFKKRYSETAKQRLSVCEVDVSKNLLQETADCSSVNLENLFVAANSSEGSTTQCPSQSNKEAESPGTMREEPSARTSTNNTRETLQPIAFPIWSPAPKQPGKQQRKSNSCSSPGRHREDEDSVPVQSDISMSTKKRTRPKKGEVSNVRGRKKPGRARKSKASSSVVSGGSAVPGKKRGRPRKSASADSCPSMGRRGDVESDESTGAEESVDCDSDIAHPVQGEVELYERTKTPTTVENAPKEAGSNRGTEQDTSSVLRIYIPGRRKPGRPKKTDQKPQPPFTCPVCNKVFIDTARLRVHIKCHNEERPFVCSICGKAFKDNSNLGGHMKTHTAEKNFKCVVCGKAFLRKIALDRHSLVHSDARPVPCDQCEAHFKSEEELRTHVKYKHIQGRKYLCSICGLGLYKESSLKTHMITHNEVKPFRCETCGKRFSSKQTLTNHEFSHKAEGSREKYLCPICGKEFMHKYYMNCHVKIHTGESNHFCSMCDRHFIKLSDYKQHMMTHTGEKPHKCPECGKAFRTPGNLKTHIMSHTDERPYKCSCGQAFRQKAKLQKHMLTKVHAEYEAKSTSDQMLQEPAKSSPATPMLAPAAAYVIEPLSLLAPLAIAWEETGSGLQCSP